MTFSTNPDPGNFFELPVVEQDKATTNVVAEEIADLFDQTSPPAEFTRRLATVQKIRDLQPIPGADAIEVATVLGWNVVVKKGEFNVGDYCVYCEIDSVLDTSIPEFAFLEKVKGRIKTIRLRGQISQGIAFPLSILPSIAPESAFGLHADNIPGMEDLEDADVTGILQVKKYEPFQNEPKHNPGMRGARTVTRPYFVPKTDEPRIQSVPDFLERHAGTTMYATEKIDGSSMSVYFRRNPEMELGEFGVCSRNLDIKDPETPGNNYWGMFHKLNLGQKLQNQNRFNSIVIQGELCGPSIQGNKLKFTEHKFFVFNIFFPTELRYANKDEFLDIVEFFELAAVPVVLENFPLTQTIPELIQLATRKSVYNDQVWAEGLVFRPETEIRDPKHGRFSFKAINPEFLLKFNE
jgi:RNA ligase (TIGR02306 family)